MQFKERTLTQGERELSLAGRELLFCRQYIYSQDRFVRIELSTLRTRQVAQKPTEAPAPIVGAMPFTVALERTGGVDFAVNGLLHLIEEVRFARDSPVEGDGFRTLGPP